ncbi:MAG: 50S ribosomal protein L3 [Candidatus Diapherotrites archaeon]|nr:50S ribosomal protein L3 [Candidatus Diapherotrites archaeon]
MPKHKPRSGSLAFYPKKRAKRQLATFTTFAPQTQARETTKALNFVGYKAGMVSCIGRNERPKSTTAGHEIIVPATVIECPPLRVFGVRLYEKNGYSTRSMGEVTVEKTGKDLKRKIVSFREKHSKKKKHKEHAGFDWVKQTAGKAVDLRLLAYAQPSMAGFGRKNPDVFEVFLSGNVEQKTAFANEKLGKEISVSEVFSEKDFADVRAVDKGKGFAGVIERAGVKHFRPKAKKHRIVGSIGPWNPSTVMWTVARPGQLGYQSRTELNKRVLLVGNDPKKINPVSGFKNYGTVKSDYVLIAGSVPGIKKRSVSLRHGIRKSNNDSFNVSGLTVISQGSAQGKRKGTETPDGEVRAEKVVLHREEKKQHKSVEDELKEAAGKK